MNPVLARLLEQREAQTTFIDQLLSRVAEENRDLVDAERSNLEAARQRITELDAQITPLEEFEMVRAAHASSAAAIQPTVDTEARAAAGGGQRLGVQPRRQEYRSAGHFVVDHLRAIGDPYQNRQPDPDAAQRVGAALNRAVNDVPPGAHQTTADTPGLLPEPIVGQILTELDGTRPFIASVGIKELASIPGKTFERPHVTQSTSVQEQLNEKGELVMGEFKVEGIPFNKRTFGGALNVSRQDIDWTSPSAWNALIEDLQFEYGEETEDIVAAAFGTGVTQSVTLATADEDDLKAWIKALYEAAVKSATANGTKRARARRLPDCIWASIDMWGQLGAVIDAVRATNNSQIPSGSATPTGFAGSLLDVPRIMAPGLPTGTLIVGRRTLFEFYEERIGLLSAIEPKYLGVQVAYGGYAAWGNLDATAFTKVTVA
ncbi:MAG: hypothetical protein QM582_09525 [Micropruina sp.]|uniref:hypothetical protein n=1 Tax=Micropruina sp. TaxID=2737536 RepID=UPI0039E67142